MEVISLIVAFIFGEAIMLLVLCIIAMIKKKKPKSEVHFYVARDKNELLWLYLGRPIRVEHMFVKGRGRALTSSYGFQEFGLNEKDFENLKWEDEPIEVFLKYK